MRLPRSSSKHRFYLSQCNYSRAVPGGLPAAELCGSGNLHDAQVIGLTSAAHKAFAQNQHGPTARAQSREGVRISASLRQYSDRNRWTTGCLERAYKEAIVGIRQTSRSHSSAPSRRVGPTGGWSDRAASQRPLHHASTLHPFSTCLLLQPLRQAYTQALILHSTTMQAHFTGRCIFMSRFFPFLHVFSWKFLHIPVVLRQAGRDLWTAESWRAPTPLQEGVTGYNGD